MTICKHYHSFIDNVNCVWHIHWLALSIHIAWNTSFIDNDNALCVNKSFHKAELPAYDDGKASTDSVKYYTDNSEAEAQIGHMKSRDSVSAEDHKFVNSLIEQLPPDVSNEQRSRLYDLLLKHIGICARSECDSCWTDLIECKFNLIKPVVTPIAIWCQCSFKTRTSSNTITSHWLFIDSWKGARYFTQLDFAQAYCNVPIAEESQYLTFATRTGLFSFNVQLTICKSLHRSGYIL